MIIAVLADAFELVYVCNGWTRTSQHATREAATQCLNETIAGKVWVRPVGRRNWLYASCTGLDCSGLPHADDSHSHRVGYYEICPTA
jgi:hypothetical protein